MPRPHQPFLMLLAARARAQRVRTHTRGRALAMLAVVATSGALLAGHGSAASSGSVVGANVLGATTLDTTLCATGDPTRTSLGSLAVGVSDTTDDDCDVVFGSSNSTATLRAYMPTPRANALASAATTVVESGNGNRVLDLEMVDGTTGWSVGDGNVNNRVRRTTDGGDTWPTVATPLGGSGRALSVVSANTVWIARYSNANVIRTDNGGSTWYSRPLPGLNARAHAIYAKDDLVAWAAGQIDDGTVKPRLWYTTDGGTTWNVVCDETCSTSQWTDIVVPPGSNTGYAVNQGGEIWRTTDGTSWVLDENTGNALQAIDGYDANHVVAVGSGGQVIRTINGGTSWNWDNIDGTEMTLRDVDYRSTGVVWAAGDYGLIGRSANHGADWTVIGSRVEPTIVNVLDATGDDAVQFAGYDETYFRTANAGSTWQVATTPAVGTNWADHDGPDGSTMWRVGTRGQIEKTTDGVTWNAQSSGTTDALYAVEALDRQRVVAVGSNGTVVRTTDGGATWATVASGTTQTLRSIAVTTADHVWVGGDAGVLRRSTDAGATFTTVASGVTSMITAVGTWDGTTVLIGTSLKELRRSTDAGATWAALPASPMPSMVTSLHAIPETTTFWASWGSWGARSANNGTTWTSSNLGSGQFVYEVDPVDTTTAWMVGRFGVVRRSTNGASSWSSVTGASDTRSLTSVVALGPDDVSVVGDGETTVVSVPGTGAPDYGDAGATWGGANGLFGICLRAAPGTGSTWPTTGSCPTSDGTNWRAVPDHGGLAAASVATTLAPGNVTASFRFGMKVPAAMPAGTYRAPIAFEVTSPGG